MTSRPGIAQDPVAPPSADSNRRATVRYHCAPATPGGVVVLEKQEIQRGWVLNLSVTGVGMLLPRPVAGGLLVLIRLKGAGVKVHELTARVAHSTREPSGEYVVGCELITRLTPEELDELLQ